MNAILDSGSEMTQYSDKCKVCSIPETLREELQKDYTKGDLSLESLCEKYNPLLEEAGSEIILNSVNLHNHFKKHYRLQDIKDSEAVTAIQKEIESELVINDGDSRYNGKSLQELVDEKELDIKPISKALLKVKSFRLNKLIGQLAHDEAFSGGQQNIKVHREINATEDSMFKIASVLLKDFYMDSSGKYDKSLYLVQDFASKIFTVLQEIEIKFNGDSSKIEALEVVKETLADLFDEYEKEVDTIKPQ